MNFDIHFQHIRSILRGEIAGSKRFVVLAFCALIVWFAVPWLNGLSQSARARLTLQQRRYVTLTQLATEYKKILVTRKDAVDSSETDVMTIFTQVSEKIALGGRVNRIVPLSDGLSIEVNRIYAEELTDLVRALALQGVQIKSAVLEALPAGNERLFSLTAVIGSDS